MNDFITTIFDSSGNIIVIFTLGLSLFSFLVGYFISLLISLFNKIIH